jgi:integrase
MGTAEYTTELEDQLYWWLAYYHFARAHEILQIRMEEPVQRKGNQRPRPYKKMTPAMAAGLNVTALVSERTGQLSAVIKTGGGRD